jgi:multidrug resistance efflux pump
VLSVGGSVLGALFGGRRGGAIAKASTAARRIGRVSKERADVEHAQADAQSLREQASAVEAELTAEVAALTTQFDPATIQLETVTVRPRKSDLGVENIALVWST